MMKDRGQLETAEKYNLLPFDVLTLAIKRTLCEKIMSLVRFSHTENPIQDLSLKTRHLYDIHQILADRELFNFFESDDFETLLLKVAKDDVRSFRNNNKWLAYHPKKAIIFSDTINVWQESLQHEFWPHSKLVYGELPDEQKIIKTIKRIKERIKSIDWSDVKNEFNKKNA